MYPKDNGHSLIIGATNTGKTHYMLNLLEKEYYKHFDDIVIFCPTLRVNKTYLNRNFIWQDDHIFVVNPENNLNGNLEYYYNVFKDPDSKTLFIIDDCSAEKSINKKREALSKLAFSGRHVGISVWILTQKYNSVSKDFRENISWLCLFFTKDRGSLEETLQENDVIPTDKIKEIKELLKQKKHSRLILKLTQPTAFQVEAS